MKFRREDFMPKKNKKVSLYPVVREIDKTLKKLAAVKRTASAAGKKMLALRIKSIRGLRKIATARCKRLSLWPPRKI
jgi:hypothetical protein